MIHDVDEALRKLVLRDALKGSKVEVSFDAPTKEWAARQNSPVVDLYLYDIHEDMDRRSLGYEARRDGKGKVTSRHPPPRRFKLSYMITAWTQRPEDEHRLLSAALGCFLRHEALPADVLPASLADQAPVLVSIALPLPEDRSISDVWSAMGGELKASLDLVLNVPFDSERMAAAGPPVLEEPRISLVAPDGKAERARGRRRRPGEEGLEPERLPVAEETVQAGVKRQAGRIVRIRGTLER